MEDRLALSALDWWEEAGVDTFVDDQPRDWLAAAPPPAAAIAEPRTPRGGPAPSAVAVPSALPGGLEAFRRFLLLDASVFGPPNTRIDAAGDPASGTMLILDMPEQGDRAAGSLLSGEVGQLFDKMLAAMSLSRAAVYLAPLSPARPASGRISSPALEVLGALMLHHIALAAPKRLLLLGDAPSRALLGCNAVEARGRAHQIAGAQGPVPAIASFHPRLLLQTPAAKKAAWDDLQRFMAL